MLTQTQTKYSRCANQSDDLRETIEIHECYGSTAKRQTALRPLAAAAAEVMNDAQLDTESGPSPRMLRSRHEVCSVCGGADDWRRGRRASRGVTAQGVRNCARPYI
ncbi:hypothetical protein RRG08_029057 [Elysia crispata]|uniref:Uncharacterized protein n=1 Tax=Elysia crispata TaxID=231223 RepID=A0AAE0ZM26_9GAST|nr:hypothetical protein RRG08_029057 [Elysia crispata]